MGASFFRPRGMPNNPNYQRPTLDPRNHPDSGGRMFIPYRQEKAPAGGYPKIPALRYRPWNYNGYYIWGGFLVLWAFGQYKVHQRSLHKREEDDEERKLRIATAPYLQSESEHFYRLDMDRWNQFEAEAMSDVEDWEVGKTCYNTERFVPVRAGSRRGHYNN